VNDTTFRSIAHLIPWRFLRDVILGVEIMQKKSESIRGHIAEFFKSGSIQDMIAGYQRKIQEICSRLKVLVNTLHFINLRIHHLL
jgi:hypothetical protein